MAQDLNVKIVLGAAMAGSYSSTFAKGKKSLGDHVRGVGDAIKQHKVFQSVMGRSDERMRQLTDRQGQLNKKLAESRGRWLALGAAIFAAGKMLSSGAAVEEQGNYLRTVINTPGDRNIAVGKSMQHARSFASNSLASQQEVLDIEYQLNSAGLAEEVSRSGTELVHKLAKVTKGAPGEVAKVFATTFNNLGANMTGTLDEKMTHIGDVLAKTQFAFQIDDFNQLGQSMAYASSQIASARIDFEQSAAAIGVLNSAGLEGSRAGTGFNAMMRNLGKSADQLGFDMVRGEDGTLDLISTLQGLQDQLDGMDIDERNGLLQKMFGEEGFAAIVPLLNKLDDVRKGTEALDKSAGTVSDSYKTFLEGSAGQMQMFGQNMKMIGTVLAGSILPGLNAVLKPLTVFMGWVAFGVEKFPPLGWVLGGLGAAIIGVAAAQMIWTAAQWALNSALLANPITWIVVGIVAAIGTLVLAITWLWKNWDTVWAGIKFAAGKAWDFLKLVFSWTPLGLLMKAWGPAMKFIGAAWDKIKAVGRFLGIGVEKSKQAVAGATAAAAVATTPLPALADLPPPAAASKMVAQDNRTQVNAPITINQQPGQNAEDLAAAVGRELDARQRQAEAEQRGALYDG